MSISKTVPLSVRVSHDDAEFIARKKVVGATTPSDKLRAIISEARKREAGFSDYVGCLGVVQDMTAPALTRIREAENEAAVHSQLVFAVSEWLEEALAFVLTSLDADDKADDKEKLAAMEKGLADRVFRITEAVLRMGVTKRNPCYDTKLISNRLGPVIDIINVIVSTQK